MKNRNQDPVRAETLEEGGRYLLRLKSECGRGVSWELVGFVCYTACPAVVVVAIGSGEKIHVAREELFLAKPSFPSLHAQLAAHSRPPLF